MKTPQNASSSSSSSIMFGRLHSQHYNICLSLIVLLTFLFCTLPTSASSATSFPSVRESFKAFQCASDLHDIATEGLNGDPHGLARPTPRENFFRWDPEAARAYFPFQALNRTIELLAFDRQGTAIAVVPADTAQDLLARRTRFVRVFLPWQCEPTHRDVCIDFHALSSRRQILIAGKTDCEGALEIPALPIENGIHLRGSPRLAFVQLPIDKQLVVISRGRKQDALERPIESQIDYQDRVRRFRERLEECASETSGINDASLAAVYSRAASEFWLREIGRASP